MRPAGTTLQAKDSLPIMDSNSRLVHFSDVLNELIAVSDDDFRSEEILGSMVIVSRTMPQKIRRVVSPSTFSILIGAPVLLQRDNM